MKTGAFKRFWGAYGKTPEDAAPPTYAPGGAPAQQFSAVACAVRANDGSVYVCDRENDRVQVFRGDGSFVKEKVLAPQTLHFGSVWDIAFSRDPQQRYLYVADGQNMKIHVLDRQSLNEITSFGDGGRYPGEFLAVNSLATDSKGNLYTVETFEGKRVQRFVFKGVGAVAKDQGVVRPRSECCHEFTRLRIGVPHDPQAQAGVRLDAGGADRRTGRRTARGPRRRQDGWCRRRGSRSIRCGRSPCLITGCSGNAIGVGVDAHDHVFIVHRQDTVIDSTEDGAGAIRRRPRAASPRRPCWSSIPREPRECVGRPGSRATSGPSPTTASPSTTRTTSGSAATAATDSHILKFTHDGKFLHADRQARHQPVDSNEHRALRPRGEDLVRLRGQRGVYRRRLRQQARRRDRHATPAR